MTRSDLRDVQVAFQHQTDRAVCVRGDDDARDIWIPLSLCQIDPADPARGEIITLTASERVLAEKGLDSQPAAGPGLFDAGRPAPRPAPSLTHQQLADQALAQWTLLREDLDRMDAAAREIAEAVSWSEVIRHRADLAAARRAATDHEAALEKTLRKAAERRSDTDRRTT